MARKEEGSCCLRAYSGDQTRALPLCDPFSSPPGQPLKYRHTEDQEAPRMASSKAACVQTQLLPRPQCLPFMWLPLSNWLLKDYLVFGKWNRAETSSFCCSTSLCHWFFASLITDSRMLACVVSGCRLKMSLLGPKQWTSHHKHIHTHAPWALSVFLE